jgi:hypothetical protein
MPADFDGSLFVREQCSPRTCERCDLSLTAPNQVVYRNESTGVVVCRYCAGEPYPKYSTRRLAWYNTWAMILSAWLVFSFFKFVVVSV